VKSDQRFSIQAGTRSVPGMDWSHSHGAMTTIGSVDSARPFGRYSCLDGAGDGT
jgi:hypothetical protein